MPRLAPVVELPPWRQQEAQGPCEPPLPRALVVPRPLLHLEPEPALRLLDALGLQDVRGLAAVVEQKRVDVAPAHACVRVCEDGCVCVRDCVCV